jgi:hypothetical protein
MRPFGTDGFDPVIELVAVKILELARDGEFDPDRLTEAVVATFDGNETPTRATPPTTNEPR